MDCRVLLVAKRPRLGRVKTRLSPPLTPGESLRLYRGFLRDQLVFLRSLAPAYGVELWTDGVWTEPASEFAPLLTDLPQWDQGPGDLGRRLGRAFGRAFETGASKVIAMGADSPTLPRDRIDRVCASLDDADASLAPAEDGGYVLLGMSRPLPALLEHVPWGSSSVADATRRAARAAGVRLAETPGWYDVDDETDLRRLRTDLGHPEMRRRAPDTAAVLDAFCAAERF